MQNGLINIPLKVAAPLIVKKLQAYVEWFDLMDKHGGWFPYPDSILDYFEALGVTHWADLYTRQGVAKWVKERELQHKEFSHAIAEAIGENPTIERVNEFLTDLVTDLAQAASENPSDAFSELGFLALDVDVSSSYATSLSSEDRQFQRDFWINQLVLFYNDLAIAAHGEPIFELVSRAINNQDDDALVKAIQIDRSLLPYFQKQLTKQSMKGNRDFLDSLAYRVNNPPRRGSNKYPLLWIFFKELLTLRCLNKSVTSQEILDFYLEGVGYHPKFGIDDVQIVQRQRRKFNQLYRQVK
ncbi:MAG: hypothetical protein FJY53_05625 [Betaproteobacteria bacterium]|nr:hypothetical protein [Betaproteobacteria bacterium]